MTFPVLMNGGGVDVPQNWPISALSASSPSKNCSRMTHDLPEAHNISNTHMYLLIKKTGLGSLRSHPLVDGKMTQCCDAKNVIL